MTKKAATATARPSKPVAAINHLRPGSELVRGPAPVGCAGAAKESCFRDMALVPYGSRNILTTETQRTQRRQRQRREWRKISKRERSRPTFLFVLTLLLLLLCLLSSLCSLW